MTHGLHAAYCKGCRCVECRKDHVRYNTAWSKKYPKRRNGYLRLWRTRKSSQVLHRIANAKWLNKNRSQINATRRSRYAANSARRNQTNARNSIRRKTDVCFRLRMNLRSRLGQALKHNYKSASTLKLLGCSIESLWLYLESRFQEGMTRENYGKVWHIDHIMPCAIFDLSNLEHQRRCFHFSNLQPLFAEDNLRKHDKIQRPPTPRPI